MIHFIARGLPLCSSGSGEAARQITRWCLKYVGDFSDPCVLMQELQHVLPVRLAGALAGRGRGLAQ